LLDGQQRLTTIFRYASNAFAVEGITFEQLEPDDRKRFLQTQIPSVEIEHRTEAPLTTAKMLELYERMNYGGTPHF
jgi:hypothetical protein